VSRIKEVQTRAMMLHILTLGDVAFSEEFEWIAVVCPSQIESPVWLMQPSCSNRVVKFVGEMEIHIHYTAC